MTRKRDSLQALNFGGEKRQAMDKRLAGFVAENAKRRPCKICSNLVLPNKLDSHMRAFHSGDIKIAQAMAQSDVGRD